MALAATLVWECRVGGNTANGGGFNPARAGAGTDYSQQNAAQVTVTDGVTNGTTTLTSATGGFDATMIGNVVGLVQGGSFRGFWEIVGVPDGNTLTLHDTVTTWANVTVRVGGAHVISSSGLPPVDTVTPVAGWKIWVKGPGAAAGDYQMSANAINAALGCGNTQPVTVEGYTTTRGDGGRPSLKMTAGSFNVLNLSGSGWIWRNFTFDGGSASSIPLLLSGSRNYVENVICKNGWAQACRVTGADNYLRRCWFKAPAATYNSLQVTTGAGNVIEHCIISGSSVAGVNLAVDAQLRSCLIYGNTQDGVIYNTADVNGQHIIGNIIWNNGRDGIRIASTHASGGLANYVIHRNVIGKNVGYDINYSPSDISAQTGTIEWAKSLMRCNAFYTTGLGRYNNLPSNSGDLTLTAHPFASDTDFTLNTVEGGGALVRSSLCHVTYPDDVNEADYVMGGLGSEPTSTVIEDARSLWREYTGEKDTTVVPDTVVDVYLQAGADELNRRVEYHLTDDSSSLVLVAGTQEYALPADCVKVVWMQWAGKDLAKRDVDDWRRRGEDWRNESGEPREWAMYANKLVLRPAPTAAAVAAAASPVFRYVSRPASVTTAGFEQLNTQDHRVAVYWGVYQWSVAYPDTALAQQRAEQFLAAFTAATQEIGRQYQERMVRK